MVLARRECFHFAVGIGAANFGDCEPICILVGKRANSANESRNVGVRLVVDFQLEIKRTGAHAVSGRGRGIILQFGIVHCKVDGIHTEAVDAAIHPEFGDSQQRLLHLRIVHIHLRLAAQKIVHIILPAPGIPCPCRAAKNRLPVIGRRTVCLGISPDVPVRFGIGPARAALGEPGVQIRCVRINLINQNLQA